MSELSVNIDKEFKDEVETKLINRLGGNVINTYCSLNAAIDSAVLVGNRPENIEELLASHALYENAVMRIFDVDEELLTIEKAKAYRKTLKMLNQQITEQESVNQPVIESPDETDEKKEEDAEEDKKPSDYDAEEEYVESEETLSSGDDGSPVE